VVAIAFGSGPVLFAALSAGLAMQSCRQDDPEGGEHGRRYKSLARKVNIEL